MNYTLYKNSPVGDLIIYGKKGLLHGLDFFKKDLIKKIGNPKAARAVGNANGKNPIVIIIPCHRVISKSGKIGGYSSGIDKKRKLLKLEGTSIDG